MVLAALALVLLDVGTPAAEAHDELVATVPAADTTLPAPPGQVELELSAPAQALGTQVVVTGPDGAVVSQGEPELRNSTVVQRLADRLPAGAYTVAWRVTSSDGHPLTGTSAFAVAGSPAVAADPAPTPTTPDAGVAAPSEGAAAQPVASSPGGGSLAAGAAGVAVLAAGVVLLRLRRRA